MIHGMIVNKPALSGLLLYRVDEEIYSMEQLETVPKEKTLIDDPFIYVRIPMCLGNTLTLFSG